MANLFNHAYPYLDEHELNLDWLIAKMKELIKDFDEFKVVNNITFSGAWDITKQYPAWTIVNDNNIGYVSIQPVPVGVVLTNTDYWIEVIDYSAQIAGLQNRVIALENTVGDASSGLVKDMNDAQYALDINSAKDVILIADSYGVDASAGGYSWTSQVYDNYNEGTVYNSSIGGTGFASDVYITDNFLSQLQGLSIPDPNRIKHIVILGGANDGNLLNMGSITEALLNTRIDAFMTYAKTNFPNAVVDLSFVGWNLNITVLSSYNTCRDCYRNKCNMATNGSYHGEGEVILHNNAMINSGDQIHPVQASSNKLAEFAMSILNNGHYVDSYIQTPTLTLDANVSNLARDDVRVIYDNDKAMFNMLGSSSGLYSNIFFTTPISQSNNIYIAKVCDILGVPNITNTNTQYCDVPVIVGVQGVGAKKAMCDILLYNGALYVRIYNIEDYVATWTLANILVPPFSITIDRRVS